MEVRDVLVIGGGPCGLAAAIECRKKGLSALVIEKGGVTESIRNYPKRMNFFSTAENIEIGGVPFPTSNVKPSRIEALQYYRKVAAFYQVELALYTEVGSLQGSKGDFTLKAKNGSTFKGKRIVVATGYFDKPRKLGIEGEDLSHVSHYYDEPFKYSYTDVVIVGAGNSGIEAALELYRHDVNVTLVHRGEDLKPTAKYWLVPDIKNRIEEGKIQVRFNSTVRWIGENSLGIASKNDDREEELNADFVLALIGYLPDTPLLQKFGIEVDETSLEPEHHSDTYRSNVDGVYLCGTVIAGVHTEKVFIENGREHAVAIASDISNEIGDR